MMRRWWLLAAFAAAPLAARANERGEAFRIQVPAMEAETVIAEKFAFCRADGKGRAEPAADISPEVRWSGAPRGARSFAVSMLDPDVPADASDVNVSGKTISSAAPRGVFYHWLLVDIPSTTRALPEGVDSSGITQRGKPVAAATVGRRGVNDYTMFLASDPAAKGIYAGYDGPCPPWNDERLHHYSLKVYALDVPRLRLRVGFDGRAFERALRGHVVARATLTRTYATARPSAVR